MNCNQIRVASLLWLSGELEAKEKRAFDRHVADCRECERFLEEQASLDATILSACGEPVAEADTAGVERRVMQRIAWERHRREAFALAAAALVALALLAGYRSHSRAATERVFVDAARDHRVEVVEKQPRRWRTELPDVTRLGANFGLTGEKAMELAPEGYRFSRARICGLEGRPALHLVFTDGVHDVSLYLRRGGGHGEVQAAAVGEEQLAALRTSGYETVAVSAGNAADCRQMVRHAALLL